MSRTPVTFLTGSLGSGKTALLAHATTHSEFAAAALVSNGCGAVGIDRLAVAALAGNVIEPRGGRLRRTIPRAPAALLHAVQNKFYPIEWLEQRCDADTDSRLVCIGRDPDTARVDELFTSLRV